ncbi:MAG TPA: glycoside hydrolase family 95 protein, partial [Chitinophagaceae bacterium]|nr:glycoside hydrolase family 95 protein [Chitinophagaceae bacterium]
MRQLLCIFFLFAATVSFSQNSPGLKLWYNQPSGNTWENALPIGNGRLGAMIYGNVEKETIQLNEHTVWSGSPNRNDNPLALDSLPAIRKLIFDGRQKEAEQLANRVILSKKSHGQMFEPVGELHLSFDEHENYTNYYRELDIERAVAKTSYTVGDVTYTREVLASFPDRVIVMHLTASKPRSLSFTAFYSTPFLKVEIKTTAIAIGARQLIISGTSVDHEGVKGMIKYKGITQIKTQGGSFSSTDTSISVKGADAATIYISIATNFNNYKDISGNENERATAYLNKVIPKSFAAILKTHVAAYQKYFNRVKLDLGTTDAYKLPTDERLKNFNSANDPQFVTLYYQFGRYLLISSSQPG